MGSVSSWGKTPRRSIEDESERRGRPAFVAGCIGLLEGREGDPELILALGGPAASWVETGEPGGPPYWLRVWAARGLLWVWDDQALPSVVAALSDDAWRVREMAAKIVARHQLHDPLPMALDLRRDPNARVRSAASRAVVRITGTAPN